MGLGKKGQNGSQQLTNQPTLLIAMQAAIKSGGMFRVAKVDAEKQRNIAEVLGIKAYPSVFGVKDGILVDNFVGVLPQDEVCVCVCMCVKFDRAFGHAQ